MGNNSQLVIRTALISVTFVLIISDLSGIVLERVVLLWNGNKQFRFSELELGQIEYNKALPKLIVNITKSTYGCSLFTSIQNQDHFVMCFNSFSRNTNKDE